MSKQEIYNYLSELDVCDVCILRYLNGRCNEYTDIQKSFQDRGINTETRASSDIGVEVTNENDKLVSDETQESSPSALSKRRKPNICIACLGIFENDMIDALAREILENSELKTYECDTLYTSISIPILLQTRELSLWIGLLKKFPNSINETQPPNISIKEVFKYLMNIKLCKETDRSLEQNQDGILVNLFFDHDGESEEMARLKFLYPDSLNAPNANGTKKKSRSQMTRNLFEKHFVPQNLDIDECIKHLPVPPNTVSIPLRLTKYIISGPTIFVAGRYRKLSRELSQSPWILGGHRVMEESVQEIIARDISPYFGIDPIDKADQINFMASGREDIDVRCLGKGRPFVLEIKDSHKSVLPVNVAAAMEVAIDASKKVSVQHLQLVKREELVHIKMGEEKKKKIYQALCILKEPATVETMQKLNIPDGFLLQQMTPLRVLHRRPFLTRPRQIYSVKGYIYKENPKVIILDVITQAGTYIKELVHGEFGRTQPSISSIIGQEVDIVALDVNAIDLDWPNEIDNKNSFNVAKVIE